MQKKLLYEVSVIRPLVIFLLVVYHALCPFTGGWEPPAGVADNMLYWWLGHLISGFRIETIALVGGYVFAYQCIERGRRVGLPRFAWKKFKRLIIPCFVFGTVYYLLFRFHPDRFSWYEAFWRVANGVGHLWFLPMLFWCFLAGWLADRLLAWLRERHPRWFSPVGWGLLVGFAALSLLRLQGLKMGLTRAPYFLLYFYLGYWLRCLGAQRWRWRGITCVALWLAYLLLLLLHLQTTHAYLPGCPFRCPEPLCGWNLVVIRLVTLGQTTCGIMALYATVIVAVSRFRIQDSGGPGPFLSECSRQCYGVYVLHGFIMRPIYYQTAFPQWCCASGVGEWLLPWAVLLMTLLLSIAGTQLLLRTRAGRFLIG